MKAKKEESALFGLITGSVKLTCNHWISLLFINLILVMPFLLLGWSYFFFLLSSFFPAISSLWGQLSGAGSFEAVLFNSDNVALSELFSRGILLVPLLPVTLSAMGLCMEAVRCCTLGERFENSVSVFFHVTLFFRLLRVMSLLCLSVFLLFTAGIPLILFIGFLTGSAEITAVLIFLWMLSGLMVTLSFSMFLPTAVSQRDFSLRTLVGAWRTASAGYRWKLFGLNLITVPVLFLLCSLPVAAALSRHWSQWKQILAAGSSVDVTRFFESGFIYLFSSALLMLVALGYLSVLLLNAYRVWSDEKKVPDNDAGTDVQPSLKGISLPGLKELKSGKE